MIQLIETELECKLSFETLEQCYCIKNGIIWLSDSPDEVFHISMGYRLHSQIKKIIRI